MTTTPQEPPTDPDIVPSGDPVAPGEPHPGEDPGTTPEPEVEPSL